jgi:hypothetical protein
MKKRIYVLCAFASMLAVWFVASGALAAHEHPIGASPLHVPLVPAFKDCTASNSVHGPPLAFNSCSPAVSFSSTIRSGNAGSVGFAQIVVCNVGASPAVCHDPASVSGGFTTAMQPDVRLWGLGRNLQCKMTGTPPGCASGSGPTSDYNPNGGGGPYTTICTTAFACGNGANNPRPFCAPGVGSTAACTASADITATAALAQPSATTVNPSTFCNPTDITCLAFANTFVGHAIRVTDHYNCDPAITNPSDPNRCPASPTTSTRSATLIDILFPVPVACLSNPEPAIDGSNCGVNTTANALVPGSVIAGKQAVVEVGEVQDLDLGPDGSRGNADDQRFATQGLYLP